MTFRDVPQWWNQCTDSQTLAGCLGRKALFIYTSTISRYQHVFLHTNAFVHVYIYIYIYVYNRIYIYIDFFRNSSRFNPIITILKLHVVSVFQIIAGQAGWNFCKN